MKSSVYKIFLAIILLHGISACQQKNTVDYLLLHPEKIQSLYDKCVYLGQKPTANFSQDCVTVLEAIPLFRSRLDQNINRPNQFALEIMQAQIRLVDLIKDCEYAKKLRDDDRVNRVKRKIEAEKFEIQSRFAIIRLVTRDQ